MSPTTPFPYSFSLQDHTGTRPRNYGRLKHDDPTQDRVSVALLVREGGIVRWSWVGPEYCAVGDPTPAEMRLLLYKLGIAVVLIEYHLDTTVAFLNDRVQLFKALEA